MTFPCRLCLINKQAKTGRAKEFKICNDCYYTIINRPNHSPNNGKYKEMNTICLVCKKPIIKVGVNPICSDGHCRGLYYRNIKNKSELEKGNVEYFISKKNHKIIREYGYEIKLVKVLEVKNTSR